MENISINGVLAYLRASNTFPLGFPITAFADDTDPLDIPSIQIGDKAMGVNGDLIVWSKANPIILNMAVIPNSVEDDLLQVLLQANRVGRGKVGANDIITLAITYPGTPVGTLITLLEGAITDGMPFNSGASAGRLKSKTYSFAFENYLEA